MLGKLKKLCIIYGSYKILEAGFQLGKGSYIYYFKPEESLKEKIKPGYALVTGATHGIGLAYAKSLAKRGYNLVLVSRDEEKLKTVRDEIKLQSEVDVKLIDFDFREAEPEVYADKIFNKLAGVELTLLVNNVGYLTSAKRFENQSLTELKDILTVNTLSVAYLTNYYLNRVAASNSKQLGKYGIINVGSLTGESPFPFKSFYASSKRFVQDFSRSINRESPGNVSVQLLAPGMVDCGNKRPDIVGNLLENPILKMQKVAALEIVENSLKNVDVEKLAGCLKHDVTAEMNSRLGALASEYIRLWNFYIMQTY